MPRRTFAPKLSKSRAKPWGDRRPPPKLPTLIPPGSDKLVTFLARRKAGESLFHPDDRLAAPRDLRQVQAEWYMAAIPGVVCINPHRWRALPYCSRLKKRVHLGYFGSRAEACRNIVAWLATGQPDKWTRLGGE